MGLAATFSRADARANGMAIALEAKRLGVDVALEPFINILRDLSFGRGWNTLAKIRCSAARWPPNRSAAFRARA
jgi:beta-glucosidase